MSVSEETKQLARYVRDRIGSKIRISDFWDDERVRKVGIAEMADAPIEGVTSYATLGLSEYSIDLISDGMPLRVEVLAAFGSQFEAGANFVSTAAFIMMGAPDLCRPGALLMNMNEGYYPDSPMQHGLLVAPFEWEVETQVLSSKKVAWLQLVPVSNKEARYAAQKGSDALQTLLEQKEIDVFDLFRVSVV